MRSTRWLLSNRLEKREGGHESRLTAIAVEAPEEYTCAIHFSTMDKPVNLSAPELEPRFIDEKAFQSLEPKPLNEQCCMASKDDYANPDKGQEGRLLVDERGHIVRKKVDPFTNKGIFHDIAVDNAFRAIISAYVFAEEIQAHLKQLEIQHAESLRGLQEMTDAQVDSALFFLHSDDVLAALGIPANHIPQKFFCAVNTKRVMTYPVRIDTGHVVDFYVLINQQKPEAFADSPHKYFNPFTGQPLQGLDMEYKLLEELDEFLSHATLHDQMTAINRRVAYHDKQFRKFRPALFHKSFDEIMRDEKFPEEMKPADLYLFNPGANTATIFTHPLLLDGIHPVDHDELMKFWKLKPENWGMNPWTGNRVKTITYDENYREDAVQFIANPEYYKTSQFKRKDRVQVKKDWGFNFGGHHSRFTIGFGVFNRRDRNPGLGDLAPAQAAADAYAAQGGPTSAISKNSKG